MPEAVPATAPAVAPPPPAPPAAPAAAAAPSPATAPAATPPAAPAAGAAPNQQPPAPATPGAPAANGAEIEIKLPEGAKVDQAQLDAFKTKAKELGLTSDQASKLVADQLKNGAAWVEALKQDVQKRRDADLEAVKADPEFGGAKFDRTKAGYASAVQQFGGEDLSKLFTAYGIDHHPAIVKTFARIRALIAEDSTVPPKAPADAPPQQPQTQTQRLAKRYDKPKKTA